MSESVTFPAPPRCTAYPDGATRCTERATVWLVDPYGQLNPYGWVCREHGEAIVRDHREKLGETWTLKPIIVAYPVSNADPATT